MGQLTDTAMHCAALVNGQSQILNSDLVESKSTFYFKKERVKFPKFPTKKRGNNDVGVILQKNPFEKKKNQIFEFDDVTNCVNDINLVELR